jgi:hypothetical protein
VQLPPVLRTPNLSAKPEVAVNPVSCPRQQKRGVKRGVILHPFLLAVFPVLFLYSYNISELWLAQLAAPLVIVAASSFVL